MSGICTAKPSICKSKCGPQVTSVSTSTTEASQIRPRRCRLFDLIHCPHSDMSLSHLWVPSSARPAATHCHSFRPRSKKKRAGSVPSGPSDSHQSATFPSLHPCVGAPTSGPLWQRGTKGGRSEFAIKAQAGRRGPSGAALTQDASLDTS